jgi:hypothetical protein
MCFVNDSLWWGGWGPGRAATLRARCAWPGSVAASPTPQWRGEGAGGKQNPNAGTEHNGIHRGVIVLASVAEIAPASQRPRPPALIRCFSVQGGTGAKKKNEPKTFRGEVRGHQHRAPAPDLPDAACSKKYRMRILGAAGNPKYRRRGSARLNRNSKQKAKTNKKRHGACGDWGKGGGDIRAHRREEKTPEKEEIKLEGGSRPRGQAAAHHRGRASMRARHESASNSPGCVTVFWGVGGGQA